MRIRQQVVNLSVQDAGCQTIGSNILPISPAGYNSSAYVEMRFHEEIC